VTEVQGLRTKLEPPLQALLGDYKEFQKRMNLGLFKTRFDFGVFLAHKP